MTTLNTLQSYGPSFQIKVLSSLIKHRDFLNNVHDVLNPEEFDNPGHKWIIQKVLAYYQKYHTNPTPEYLSVEVKKIENEILKVAVAEQVKEALKSINEDREYVEGEFSNFCKNQKLKNALISSVEKLSNGQYDEIRHDIDQALKAGTEKNLGHEYEKDIETRYREEERGAIPTFWPKINELLMGGLGVGELGVILGSPGGGKSWFLVNLGAAAVKAGYTVLHYTLELTQDYVGKRYDSIFTGIEFQQIQHHRKEVESAIENLKGKLIIKEFPMGKTRVSSIESHIQKVTSLGQKPDLVIIDYVDLLKSRSKSVERKDAIDDVYTEVKGLASQLRLPIWTVSQVNRMGAKDDIVEADKTAGSYDKIMIASFVMSLSRKRQDKVNGTGRIHVIKNRFGSDGMTFAAKIDTSRGKIEIETSEMDDSQFEDNESNTQTRSPFQGKLSPEDRSRLAQKFFQLKD